MEIFTQAISYFLHIDEHLSAIVASYGALTNIFLFIIVFAETGLVVTPFLPGDSLLFAAGAVASLGQLNIVFLWLLLFSAAVLGDTVNYWIGHKVGPAVFEKNHFLLRKKHLDKTQEFYDKHGGKVIILARFIPVIRTFAPFVAGVGKMEYRRFLAYNVIGGFIWVTAFTWAGFFFGNLPIVKDNFSLVVLVIIVLSIVPILIDIYKTLHHKIRNRNKPD